MQICSVPEPQWYASRSCNFATKKWAHVLYSDRCTQSRLDWLHCQMEWANMLCWICHNDMPRILQCTRTSIMGWQKLRLWDKYVSLGVRFRHRYSISLEVAALPVGLANMQWSISHMYVFSSLSSAPELRSNGSKSCGFSTNNWAVSHIVTKVINIA